LRAKRFCYFGHMLLWQLRSSWENDVNVWRGGYGPVVAGKHRLCLKPLEQAKLDLVSAYTLNSMFWVYLATQGINPKEHPVKQELGREYINSFRRI
uniref:Nuclear nucleic acid-binding protein C1D n=1 Tax=Pavo cristatus TaxID=9049 RepID=A0A8C9FV45_PAVCR